MLAVLIKYGYYDDTTDVNELLPSIYKIMNGTKDFPTKQIKDAMGSVGRRKFDLHHLIVATGTL